MSNNGMIEYKEGFISKIKNFFKRLFGKQEEQYNYIQEEQSINEIKEERQEKQDKFVNEIKVDTKAVDSVIEKKNFLEEIYHLYQNKLIFAEDLMYHRYTNFFVNILQQEQEDSYSDLLTDLETATQIT